MEIYAVVIISILLIIILYTLFLYNAIVALNNKVKEAFSTMDIYLKKRWDLVPNLVETVKGYAKHENITLKEVTDLRSSAYNQMGDEEKIHKNEKLNLGIDKLMIMVEAYPELKADGNFRKLATQLIQIEDEIANSRKYYNGIVKIYNIKIETFPNNIFAKVLNVKSKLMFSANEENRQNVFVNLGGENEKN